MRPLVVDADQVSRAPAIVANTDERVVVSAGDTAYVSGLDQQKGPRWQVYRKGRMVLKAVKLGRLGGECGDRTKTLKRGLPRGLRPGRYTLMFTTSPSSAGGERISFRQRLR